MRFHRLLKLSVLILILAMAFPTLAQTDATIVISPETGVVGNAIFEITISDLTPGGDYTVDFVIDGESVFTTAERADSSGTIFLSIGSDATDPVGDYVVEVREGNAVIAEGGFTLTGEGGSSGGDNQTTELETFGNILITPTSGEIGTVHTISIGGLDNSETVTVEILNADTEQVIYRRDSTANEGGRARIEIFTEEGDNPGLHYVEVIDSNGETIARGDFRVLTVPDRDGTLTISPSVGLTGTTHEITVTGLFRFDSVTINLLDGRVIVDTIEIRADRDGNVNTRYVTTDELGQGVYDVEVLVDGEIVATGALTIGVPVAVQTGDAGVNVTPAQGVPGTAHTVNITGLDTDAEFTLTITNIESGEIIYRTTRNAEDDGSFRLALSTGRNEVFGDYRVTLTQDDETIAQSTLTVLPSPRMSVDPLNGLGGTSHTVAVEGLEANETVTFSIVFNDETVFSSEETADANGEVVIPIASNEDDEPGNYRLLIARGDETVARTSLTIDPPPEPVEETPPAEEPTAEVAIDPASAERGTTFAVTVTGLDAEEAVTVDVIFDGESVFSTDKVADADGTFTMNLTTDESDSAGDYTFQVTRADGTTVEAGFTIEGTESTAQGSDDNTNNNQQSTASGDSIVYEGSITASNPTDRYIFNGEAGDVVAISLNSDDFDTYLRLENDLGVELTFNDDSGGTLNSFIGPFTLPYSGDYVVVIEDFAFESNGGDFVLTIDTANLAGIAFDEPVTVNFTGDSGTQFFSFEASAGELINVTAESPDGLDTTLSVTDPNGFEIAFDDDSGVGLNPEISQIIIESDGTYLVSLQTFTNNDVGEVSLTVSRNESRRLEDGTQTIRINDKIARDLVVFEGQAGETVTVTVEIVSGEPNDLFINANQDDYQLMSYSTMMAPTTFDLTFMIPEDGTVGVFFEDFSFGANVVMDITLARE